VKSFGGGPTQPVKDDEKYKGATVLTAKVGVYLDPVVVRRRRLSMQLKLRYRAETCRKLSRSSIWMFLLCADIVASVQCLDYSAMYPSIMRAHNLCPSTWVLDPHYGTVKSVEYGLHEWKDDEGNACGAKFVTSRKGVVVHLLEELTTMQKVSSFSSPATAMCFVAATRTFLPRCRDCLPKATLTFSWALRTVGQGQHVEGDGWFHQNSVELYPARLQGHPKLR
jgi:hypothetical protein